MLAAISVTAKKFKTSRSQSDGDSEMETYFSVYNRSLGSSSSNNTDSNNNDNNGDPDFKIPASFCVDWVSEKVLSCPRMKLASSAKVLKCCPFGKELKHPLLSGCIPSDINQSRRNWALRINGHAHFLHDLIRFPYEFVVHNHTFLSSLESSCGQRREVVIDVNVDEDDKERLEDIRRREAAEDAVEKRRIMFDFDAFQLDTSGRLTYARPLSLVPEFSGRPIESRQFCVDMIEKNRRLFMAAVFCSPKPMTSFNEDYLSLEPPSRSDKLASSFIAVIFVSTSGVFLFG